jgi:sigma-B regulation protein RsbU (phosphoserine phosphatase)
MAGELSASVSDTLEAVEARKAIESELDVASDIQMSMLPLTFPQRPEFTEFELYAHLVPAKEVGGDFYEFGSIDPDHFFFCVGDVSGKGVPAALFMAASKTLIRSGALLGEPPAELLTRINSEIVGGNTECMFATVWLGVLNLRSGKVTFTNAGHNPPWLLPAGGEPRLITDLHGPFVGPVPGATYSSGELTMHAGDTLVVYSDGVTEAMSPDDDLYSDDRLRALLTETDEDSVEGLTRAVIDDVLRWEQGNRSDDLTVLTMTFNQPRDVPKYEIKLDPSQIMDEASRLNTGVAAFTREQAIPEASVQRLQTVLDEILTNVAMHADAEFLSVSIWISEGLLTTKIVDDGDPFNPLEAPAPDTDLGLQERAVGGLGIHLVRSLMSTVEYEYRSGRNMLTMTMEL